MQLTLNPIMAGILGSIILATGPTTLQAAVYNQVDLTAGGGPTTLGPDDQVIFHGTNTGGAVIVGPGQTFTANGTIISADGERVYGIGSSAQRATVNLSNNTITVTQTNGTNTIGAINLSHQNSNLLMDNVELISHGQSSPAINLGASSTASITGGSISSDGRYLFRTGSDSTLAVTGSTLTQTHDYSNNFPSEVFSLGSGSNVTLDGVTLETAGQIGGTGYNSTLSINNSVLNAFAGGIWAQRGSTLQIDNSQIYIGDEAIKGANTTLPHTAVATNNGTVILTDSTVRFNGGYSGNIFKVEQAGGILTLKNVSAKDEGATGSNPAIGIWLIDNAIVELQDVDLEVGRAGIDMRQGEAFFERVNITTLGDGVQAHGIYVDGNPEWAADPAQDKAIFHGKDLNIHTKGRSAAGVYVLTRDGFVLDSEAQIENLDILTEGENSHGVYMYDGVDIGTPSLDLKGSTTITTTGDGAVGVFLRENPKFTFEQLAIKTSGENADGFRLSNAVNNGINLAQAFDGITIDSAKASALRASNVGVDLDITDSDIRGRQLLTLDGEQTALTTSSLQGKNSLLIGDLKLRDGGQLGSFILDGQSRWAGGVDKDDSSAVGTVSLQNNSVWLMTRSSEVDTVINMDGYLLFQPDLSENFKTLHVNHFAGGGHLAMSVYLADDASGTDQLIIGENGSVTGTTELHILNVDGPGGMTRKGIPLVLGGAGAIIPDDAFTLSAISSGYRPDTGTVSAHGFEYSLVSEDADNNNTYDWYLRSSVPGSDGDHDNVSPEAPAYLAAHRASLNLFAHSFHEREINQQGLDGGQRKAWARAQVRTDRKMGFEQFDTVDAKVNSSMVQFGGDIWDKPLAQGQVRAGLMAGAGYIEAKSGSLFIDPENVDDHTTLRARDKRTGYNIGAYATYQENALTRQGWFVDGALQFTHFRGKLHSDLGNLRHNNNLWQLAAEAGYGWKHGPDSTLLITPKAQLTYSHLSADKGEISGTSYAAQHRSTVQSRVGVRLEAAPDVATMPLRPFMELAWIHRFREPAIVVGDSRFTARHARNAGEVQLGVDGELSKSTMLSARLIREQGAGSTYGMSGMINLNYRW